MSKDQGLHVNEWLRLHCLRACFLVGGTGREREGKQGKKLAVGVLKPELLSSEAYGYRAGARRSFLTRSSKAVHTASNLTVEVRQGRSARRGSAPARPVAVPLLPRRSVRRAGEDGFGCVRRASRAHCVAGPLRGLSVARRRRRAPLVHQI